MTDAPVDIPGDDEAQDAPQPHPAPADKPAERMFTQVELDQAVKGRLERAKAKADAERTSLQAQLTAAEDDNKSLTDTLDAILAERVDKMPEGIRALVSKLSPAERYAWLRDNADKTSAVLSPVIPKPSAEGGRTQSRSKPIRVV